MFPFRRSNYPTSYQAKQLINSRSINVTYLGAGRFLYSISFRGSLRFGRLDLYTPKKMLAGFGVIFLYVALNLVSPPNPNSDEAYAAGGAQVEGNKTEQASNDRAETQAKLGDMTENEAFESGDAIRKKFMSDEDVDDVPDTEHEAISPEKERPKETNFIEDLDGGALALDLEGPHNLTKKFKPLKVQEYVVQKSDSIGRVAQKFGIDKETVAVSAKITLEDPLPSGKKINIPNYKGYYIRSKKGDNLAKIAQRYKLNYEKFMALNNLEAVDRLPPGKKLFLPDKKSPSIRPTWILPTRSRVVNSGYGWRRYPRRAFHEGIDLRSRYEPVRAARDGTVIYSGWMGAYGKAVVIKHFGGYKTLYAHNSRLYVRRGQKVSKGQTISRSGNTGYSFGPHVHFEVSRYGRHINPMRFFKGLRYKGSRKRRRR